VRKVIELIIKFVEANLLRFLGTLMVIGSLLVFQQLYIARKNTNYSIKVLSSLGLFCLAVLGLTFVFSYPNLNVRHGLEFFMLLFTFAALYLRTRLPKMN